MYLAVHPFKETKWLEVLVLYQGLINSGVLPVSVVGRVLLSSFVNVLQEAMESSLIKFSVT